MSFDRRVAYIGEGTAYAFESISVSSSTTAVGFTASNITPAFQPTRVIITVEDGQIRYRYDGTDPTATVGHLMNSMDALVLKGKKNIEAMKFIRKTTTNATIMVTYER